MKRLHTLSGMRGIAAASVVALHLNLAHVPCASVAVDLFFILSGVVIEGTYGTRQMTCRQFILVRARRLYPLYALGIILGALATHFYPGQKTGIFDVLDVSNKMQIFLLAAALLFIPIGAYCFPLDGPAWSLFYEIVANLVWKWGKYSSFVLAGIVILSAVAMVQHTQFWNRVAFSFPLGVLMYRHQSASWRPHGALLCLISTSVVVCWQSARDILALILIINPMIVWVAIHTRPRRAVAVMEAAGDISYPLYILHLPLAMLHLPVALIPPVCWVAGKASSWQPGKTNKGAPPAGAESPPGLSNGATRR